MRLTGTEERLLLSMLISVRWTHSHMEAGISVSLLYLKHRPGFLLSILVHVYTLSISYRAVFKHREGGMAGREREKPQQMHKFLECHSSYELLTTSNRRLSLEWASIEIKKFLGESSLLAF